MRKIFKSMMALGMAVAIPFGSASAVPLPDLANGAIRIPEEILQALENVAQLEEALSIEMTTFDYMSGLPSSLDIGATWGDFNPEELIKSSAVFQSILDGSFTDASKWYVDEIGLGLETDPSHIAPIAESLYQLPINPDDDTVEEIEQNLDKGTVTAMTSAMGMSVAMMDKYKYNMDSFLKYDETLLTSDDTSVSKYYAALSKVNALTSLAILEGAQMRAKQAETTAAYNMFQHKVVRVEEGAGNSDSGSKEGVELPTISEMPNGVDPLIAEIKTATANGDGETWTVVDTAGNEFECGYGMYVTSHICSRGHSIAYPADAIVIESDTFEQYCGADKWSSNAMDCHDYCAHNPQPTECNSSSEWLASMK